MHKRGHTVNNLHENNEVQKSYAGLEDKLITGGGPTIISAGISLSNSPHIGHMREFFVAHSSAEYLREKDIDVQIIAVADDLDPLKKLYADMPDSYKEFIGQPLINVPDHTGQFALRVEKNLFELQSALRNLDIDLKTVRSSELYATSEMSGLKIKSLREAGRIGVMLSAMTGSETELTKGIINASCPSCSKVNVKYSHDVESGSANMTCYACQFKGEVNLLDPINKFRWRVDWPARWYALGVDVEPVAEDHSTKGGSFETASAIAREIYGISPPVPLEYRWVRHESGGAIHGSDKPLTAYEASRQIAPLALRSFFGSHANDAIVTIRPGELLGDALLSLKSIDQTPDNDAITVIYRLKESSGVDASKIARAVYGIENEAILDVLDRSSSSAKGATLEVLEEEYMLAAKEIFCRLANSEWPEVDDELETLMRNFFNPQLNRRKLFKALYEYLIIDSSGPRLTKLLRAVGRDGLTRIISKRDSE